MGELEENKKSMMQIVVLVLIFSILQNFLGLVENSYITELCYVLTYLVLMLFVLKPFPCDLRDCQPSASKCDGLYENAAAFLFSGHGLCRKRDECHVLL